MGEQAVGWSSSTGLACAPTRRAALLLALWEVLERDAFMIVWRNCLTVPRIVIDGNSSLHDVFTKHFVRPGLEFRLYSTELDLPIATVFGVLIDHAQDPPAVIVGGAARPSPEKAVAKTLMELAQGLSWADTFSDRFFTVQPGFENVRDFEDRVKLYAFNPLLHVFDALESGVEVPLSALPTHAAAKEPALLTAALAAQDLEVLAKDITTIDVNACGQYVVRVIVPGAEVMEADHRMPLLGGRRWSRVPRLLGRSPSPGHTVPNIYPHPYP
jgi:ribosomal protein S12 methylthiotransferase accessory factor